MLNRLQLVFACLALTLLLPCAALADDEPKPSDDPAPKDTPEDPPKDAPKEETPKEDAPKEDAPKDEAPKGDAPKDEEPSEEDPTDEEPADEGEPKEEPAKEERPAANQATAPAPTPAGMAYLEAGRVRIGSERPFLTGLLAGRPPEHQRLFRYETPYHALFLRPYFIAKHEVTNAQYHVFLKDFVTTYDTASGSLANLDEISAHLARLSPDEQKNPKQNVWLQFYRSNKDILWKAFEARMADFMAKRVDGTIDEYATARKMRFEPLPRTLKLKFYSMRPPANWPDMGPPAGEGDHPVRFVSYNDAERFAEWAGMHIPTEEEWEWAARGPSSPTFPWGNQWPPNALYANWGGKITNDRYEPTTLPVATRNGANPSGDEKVGPLDGDGRSWCGCHHMVGNVAEWTSSWFKPYGPSRAARHTRMGQWVKIIRGGGAGDGEMLVLRAACRNFVGGGPDAPPYPENYFQWVGFRLASYMKSGRDQLGPIIRRADKAKKMPEATLALDRFIGSVTRNWVEPEATPDNHVYIRGRSQSIVLIPHTSLLRPTGLQDMQKAWKRPTSFKKVTGLRKKSQTEHPFFTLGVLHSDVPITPVMVRKPEEPTEDGKKKKKKKRRRGRAKAPETIEGTCPPGTYLLGVWFGQLAILTTSGEFYAFLPKPEGADKKWTAFSIEKLDATPESSLAVDSDLDWADFSFAMPVGGKATDEKLHLVVKGQMRFEVGALDEAGVWIQEDPAKELTAKLRADFDAAEAEEAKKRKKGGRKKKGDAKKTASAK